MDPLATIPASMQMSFRPAFSKDGQGVTDGVESSHPKKDVREELFLLPGNFSSFCKECLVHDYYNRFQQQLLPDSF